MRIVGIIHPPRVYAIHEVFPGKPLALIARQNRWCNTVVEQCEKATTLSEVIVATDDTRIWGGGAELFAGRR